MKPLAFKVRTQGTYNGAKGGKVKAGFGGAGALWYEDKTFTIAAVQDQWLLAPTLSLSLSLSHPKPPMTQQPIPQLPLRFLSVCSGMEAASVAWEPLGWKAVGFSEIEPFPCAILAHRFPNTPNHGSLTEHHTWPIEPGTVDLLVGGTPCQSYSVAGKRGGLNDPRGQLMLSFLDLAQRLKARWVVWENVPGVLSSGQPRGSDFATFLQGLVERGYGWAFRVLDAQHFGVPQRRRRVFVVACLGAGGWESAAKVLFEPESLCGDTAKGRKKGQGVASDAQGGAGSGSGLPRTVGTLCADTHPGAYTGQDAYTGRLIPASKPLDESKPIVIDRAAFNQGENAKFDPHIGPADVMDSLVARGPHAVGVRDAGVPFRKSKRASSATDSESWVEAAEANTLNNFDLGDTRTTHAVVQPVAFTQNQRDEVRLLGDKAGALSSSGGTHQTNYIADAVVSPQVYENHPNDSRVTGPLEVSPTVVSRFGTGGGNVPLVNNEPTAITFQPGNLRREAGAEPSTTTTTTLKASAGDQMPHVVHPVVPLDGMSLLSRLGECGETHSMQNFDPNDPQFTLRKGGSQHGVLTPMAVRRLTPTECMRLQGFPDNWANIPWKGKPEGQAPDGPQYRAAGNSMAVPVMRWIGTRIAQVEAGEIK